MDATPNRMSPRQKMINLMYLVLTAMLALNVSSDVLDGFNQVHYGLMHSNGNAADRNAAIYAAIENFARNNPDKGGPWLAKAVEVRAATDGLICFVDSLKLAIVREADGDNADVDAIKNREDLEAASVVMLASGSNRGENLRHRVAAHRERICAMLPDSVVRGNIRAALSAVDVPQAMKWEEAQFDHKSVLAAVTLLAKLQNDLLYAEGEALRALHSQIDATDVRVNELKAFVVPQSRVVMRGQSYKARVVLAAVDTTRRPDIYVDGRLLTSTDGDFSINATAAGTYDYSGHVRLMHDDGSCATHNFSSSYTVIEPAATVSATMMNVLYAGISNPLSISVPGVPAAAVSAKMTNGSLVRRGDVWVATPDAVGKDAVISVSADIDGASTTVATHVFRVRRLPDPAAYISYVDASGHVRQYKGSGPMPKSALLKTPVLEAAIDDGMLDAKFTVLGFQTVFFDAMGNAMPENSDGAEFSARQRQQIQRLARGKRFYISGIRAKGPDGTVRNLSPIEVIVN